MRTTSAIRTKNKQRQKCNEKERSIYNNVQTGHSDCSNCFLLYSQQETNRAATP